MSRSSGWRCSSQLRKSGEESRDNQESCSTSTKSYGRCVPCIRSALAPLVKPTTVAAIANLIMAVPAHAEAGKLFDFNLTLPAMAAEFLLLMVFLDKTWFTPVGELLDKRDAELRGMVGEVKDNSSQLAALKAEAEEILRAARADAQSQLKAVKAECQADMDAKYGAAKK
eukprot:scaffold360145_cov33-Prasinocladus_malaysianus.AAC.1